MSQRTHLLVLFRCRTSARVPCLNQVDVPPPLQIWSASLVLARWVSDGLASRLRGKVRVGRTLYGAD